MSAGLLVQPPPAAVHPAGRRVATARDINDLTCERGWSRAELVRELRRAAHARRRRLPADASMTRMVKRWANGHGGLSPFYADLFTAVFGVRFASTADRSGRSGCPLCGATADEPGSCARAGGRR